MQAKTSKEKKRMEERLQKIEGKMVGDKRKKVENSESG